MKIEDAEIEKLARTMANAKLGEGDSVRCEGPTEFEINQARPWARRALAALAPAPAPASGGVDAVAAIAKIIDPEGFKLLAEGNNLTTGQAANYRDAYGKAHLILASLSTAATPVSETDTKIKELKEALSYAVSCLVSVRKNYEELGLILWEDVSKAIKQGNEVYKKD